MHYELTPIEPTTRIGFALAPPVLAAVVPLFAQAHDWPDALWALVRRDTNAAWVLECDPPGYVPAGALVPLGSQAPVITCPHHRAVWAYLGALPPDTPVVLRKVES